MKRTDLIEKIVSYAGVNDSDAKSFMELFLLHLSRILDESLYFNLPAIGNFRFQRIEQKKKHTRSFFNAIFFSENEAFFNTPEELVFNVTNNPFVTYEPIDAYFSIGIDKPVISSRLQYSNELEDYLNPVDAKVLLEVKVESLIAKGSVLKLPFYTLENLKENNSILNLPEEFEINYSASLDDVETNLESEKNIPWDFGVKWTREYEEHQILNDDVFDRIDDSKVIEPGRITELPEEVFSDFSEEKITFNDLEKIYGEIDEKEIEIPFVEEEIYPSEEPQDEEIRTPGTRSVDEYSYVTPRTKELNISASDLERITGYKTTKDFESTVEEKNVDLSEFIIDLGSDEKNDDFTEVRKEDERFKLDEDFIEPKAFEFTPPMIDENVEGELLKKYDDIAPSHEVKEEKTEQIIEPVKQKKDSRIWTVLSGILIILIAGLFYVKFAGFPDWLKGREEVIQKLPPESDPIIIEREYSVPVNYPYNRDSVSSVSQSKLETGKQEIQSAQHQDASEIFSKANPDNRLNKEKPEENKSQLIESSLGTKVSDQIFVDGGQYIVQVSSWRSKPKAEEEIKKYNRRGFKSLIEEAHLPDKGGSWYRVKVGYFKTLSEAENFLQGIK